jgi:hypothetical protein
MTGRAEHGQKTDAVESCGNEIVQRPAQIDVIGRHRDPRRDLHAALLRQQRLQVAHDAIEAAGAALVRPQLIVQLARAVEADRDGKTMRLEERSIGFVQQRSVRRNREAQRNATALGDADRSPRTSIRA